MSSVLLFRVLFFVLWNDCDGRCEGLFFAVVLVSRIACGCFFSEWRLRSAPPGRRGWP